ncbi:MAG: dATP/dGTP diphosphohydrolase domain-containing protein [Aquabacterium sp.]
MTERICDTCAFHDPNVRSLDDAPPRCWDCKGKSKWMPKAEAPQPVRVAVREKSPDLWTGSCPPGTKADAGKRQYSLLPEGALEETVDVLTIGAMKYAPGNWKSVPNARTRYFDAGLRHAWAWFHGEQRDPETGKHHLAHACACFMFLMWFDLKGKIAGKPPVNQ